MIFVYLFFSIWAAFADSEKLTVGCTIDCGKHVVERIEHAAQAHHYSITFIDLSRLQSKKLKSALSRIDAVISPGGDDIEVSYFIDQVTPERRPHVLELDAKYGQHSPESRIRDAHELNIRKMYFSEERFRELPFLGICYGMQAHAVSRGIPLVIDIKAEFGIPNRKGLFDRVRLTAQTLVDTIFGSERELVGLESHHQAVDAREFERLHPTGVRITGISNGGLVPEAIEFEDRPLAVGVQFHPEGSDLELSDKIFGWLLEQAKRRAHQRAS